MGRRRGQQQRAAAIEAALAAARVPPAPAVRGDVVEDAPAVPAQPAEPETTAQSVAPRPRGTHERLEHRPPAAPVPVREPPAPVVAAAPAGPGPWAGRLVAGVLGAGIALAGVAVGARLGRRR